MSAGGMDLDFIEELRLRRWARENYVPRTQRQHTWHPVVHDEMTKKEGEMVNSVECVYVSRA